MIKELPKSILKDGHQLTLVERKGHVCIYRCHVPGGHDENDCFEVIIPHIYRRNFHGPCEPYESYPGSHEWGRKGWTFSNGKFNPETRMVERVSMDIPLRRAREKMRQLLKGNRE